MSEKDSIREYQKKGYSEAEVEILVKIERIDTNLGIVMGNYVKREEFEPIQRLVYGLVGVVLLAVVSGLVALVLIP